MWSLIGGAHRRLKNIIVLLEWIPSVKALSTVTASELEGQSPLQTDDQKNRLERAFGMFDTEHRGKLKPNELVELMVALDAGI